MSHDLNQNYLRISTECTVPAGLRRLENSAKPETFHIPNSSSAYRRRKGWRASRETPLHRAMVMWG